MTAEELRALVESVADGCRSTLRGASVAVVEDGEMAEAAVGVVDPAGELPAAPSTAFPVWSVTKVYTATLFMTLVDDGAVELDTPVMHVLPEFAVAGQVDAPTCRQLLAHAGGIDGAFIADCGSGDDCRARFVAELARIPATAEPGVVYSYSNAGYIVIGRVIEIITGQPWEDALRARVLEPAGLTETVAEGASGTALFVAASGGVRVVEEIYPRWRSCAPCGSTMWATARDVARFGIEHAKLISQEAADDMVRPVIPLAGREHEAAGSATGWKRNAWGDGSIVLWHGGGAHALLHVLPEHRAAIAVLSNGPGGDLFRTEVVRRVEESITRAGPVPLSTGASQTHRLDVFAGTYQVGDPRRPTQWSFSVDADSLVLSTGARRITLERRDDTVFTADRVLAAFTICDGRATHVSVNNRALRRVAGMTDRVTAVHQILPSFHPYDAIGQHALTARSLLRDEGYASDIYAGGAISGRSHGVRDVRTLDGADSNSVLIYQLSIGSELADFVMTRPERVVVNYHNITPARFFAPWSQEAGREMRDGRRQLVTLAERAELGIAVSRYNEDELRAAGYRSTAVAPVLIDVGVSEPRAVKRSAVQRLRAESGSGAAWLFLGRLAPNKCQHDVIAAFAAYRKVYDANAKLRFVGATSSELYARALRRIVIALELDDAVDFVGSASPELREAHFDAADVFVCLSEHEGFCVPVLEAMSRRLPVIAFAAAAVPETVEDAALVLTEKHPLTVAAAADCVRRDAVLRGALVERGSERAACFALASSRERFMTALNPVLRQDFSSSQPVRVPREP